MSVTIRSRTECNSLPGKGWQREEVRKTGISAGQVYYYSPTGKKIMSKHQLARYLGDSFDISSFDFQTGKVLHYNTMPTPSISLYRCSPPRSSSTNNNNNNNNSNSNNSSSGGTQSPISVGSSGASSSSTAAALSAIKRKCKSQFGPNAVNITLTPIPGPSSASTASSSHASQTSASSPSLSPSSSSPLTSNMRQQQQQQSNDYSRALRTDLTLVPPIRQTASIFKQPVTVVRNHVGKVKEDLKHTGQEKPKQVFWEKRLERMKACHETGDNFVDVELPKSIKCVGPNVSEQTVLQSVATALHMLNGPITGQTAKRSEFDANATAYIDAEQPLMEAVLISDEDIRQQEEKVNAARRKLQDALKA